MSKKLIMLACVASLAACDSATGDNTPVAAAPEPGLYEVANAEGTTFRTQLYADNTFSTYIGDEVVETGQWSWSDGNICYDGEAEGQDEVCWTQSAPDGAGGYIATRGDGQTVTVTRIE